MIQNINLFMGFSVYGLGIYIEDLHEPRSSGIYYIDM